MSMADDIRREKARNLRYKRPMLMTAPDDYDRVSKFDRMAAMLPDEAWLR